MANNHLHLICRVHEYGHCGHQDGNIMLAYYDLVNHVFMKYEIHRKVTKQPGAILKQKFDMKYAVELTEHAK